MGLQKLLTGARQHVTDSVGLFVVSTPLGAFLENVLAGMSDEVSFKSRAIVGGLYLGGLGGIMGYFRDKSRKLFHVTDKTKEGYQQIHDMAYIATVTAIVNPLIYLGAGAKDAKEIALGTGFATLTALCTGGIMGYSVDLFRDLTGYKKSERIPQSISYARPYFKKSLAAGILTTSIGLAGLVYHLTPDQPEEINEETISSLETISDNNDLPNTSYETIDIIIQE
ncbi:MAG: L-alanine exporter AlaE [archaeon]